MNWECRGVHRFVRVIEWERMKRRVKKKKLSGTYRKNAKALT